MKSECIDDYNETLMDPLTPTCGYLLRLLQIPAIIACILCFKWRFLADYFIHAENFIQFVAVMHISYTNYSEDFPALVSRIAGMWIAYTMSNRAEIVFLSLNMAFRTFVGLNIAYNRPLTKSDIFLYLLTTIIFIFL